MFYINGDHKQRFGIMIKWGWLIITISTPDKRYIGISIEEQQYQ